MPLLNETVKRFAQAHPKTVRVPPPRYRSFPAVRARLYRIADAHQTTLQDPGRDAAVTAHRVVAARPKVILHARAGLAVTRAFEHGLADTKTAVLERREADAGDDQVTAQQRGIDGVESRQRGDGAEMFLLNEGDLPLAAAACGAVIPSMPVSAISCTESTTRMASRGAGRRPIQATRPLRGNRARRSPRVVSLSSMCGWLPCDLSKAQNRFPEQ